MENLNSSLSWQRLNSPLYNPYRLLRDLGINKPPVDVFAIPAALGVRLHFVKGSAWDGAVESAADGRADIYVNAGQGETRQRFTVAHELGHLLLHEPGRAFRDQWRELGSGVAEIQANNFAANLLMPSWMVNAIAQGKSVRELADIFHVSQEAMHYRLKNLGYRI